MDSLKERAARWGIETEYWDGLGRHRAVEPETLVRLIDTLTPKGEDAPRDIRPVEGTPPRAYQGPKGTPERLWAFAVQLYGVRSRRNWGHGDFTDLSRLIGLAAGLGAAGVGVNPLHALFDDRASEFSPYSPSSRLFLNTRYIDPEVIPEFSGTDALGLDDEIAALRATELMDYQRVVSAKSKALEHSYQTFRTSGASARKKALAEFRDRGGILLMRFAAFEILRRQFSGPWWTWPEEWRTPDDTRLAALRERESSAAGFHEFLQWVAYTQLSACREQAKNLGMPLGLYLDIAVGVRADGFDAWNEQGVIEPGAEIGAPPDPLNLEGQRWGLAAVNPFALEAKGCEPFRQVLHASMQYAGAVRLDHVMALQRLYLIPSGMRGDQGAYVNFPFARLLAITAEESAIDRSVVIGEDLGTVPEQFRERLADAGLWSYQVMLFQRAKDRGFIAPDLYRENALVTFSTHDLPTFAGWMSGHDLSVKRMLGLDPGETMEERKGAREAMARTMAWHGFPVLDYRSVIAFLASTPSRLLIVAVEDVLELTEQMNVPGTIAGHPNWRRRLPANLEDLGDLALLRSVAETLAAAGRSVSYRNFAGA